MLLPFLTLFDFGTVRANFKKPIDLTKIKKLSHDYVILVPIFNTLEKLTNVEFLSKFRERVILCTTDQEKPEFLQALAELSKKYGFRVTQTHVDVDMKNPWAIYIRTLVAHDAVLKDSIVTLKEKYVIFIDGDTIIDGDPAVLAGAMDEFDYDISSVRVLPSKRETLAEKLQGVEYDIAMQARLIYPWLTSGAGMVARREIMTEIMKNHSLFFNGGDIEIGKLADMMGYKVGHLPMNFYTDIPPTFRTWSRQRFSWMCGCFRHSVINMDHNLRHPFHFIYFSFIIYFLLPIKLFEMVNHFWFLPILILIYMVFTYLANWKVRSKWMLLFPFYALYQVTILLWCGIYRYFVTVYKSRNIGRIRVRHNPNNVRFLNPRYTLGYLRTATLSLGIVFLLAAGASSTTQKILFGRSYESMEYVMMAKDIGVDIADKSRELVNMIDE